MANANRPLTFALATVTVAGTSVTPSSPIPDNCKEVVILNRGTGDALVGIAAAGAGTLTEGTNATRIPENASLRLGIGTIQDRGDMAAAGSGLVYVGDGAATPVLDITYVNVLGRI